MTDDTKPKTYTEAQFLERLRKFYPAVDTRVTPLPTRWADSDEYIVNHLALKNGKTRVEYKGKGMTHKDAAAVRSQHPIPKTCGIFYYEVKIINKGRDGYIGMGLSDIKVKLNRLPGWDENSYGYHGDDGNIFAASGSGHAYGPTFTTGDVIGCCFNLADKTIFFTKNGENLDIAFRGVTSTTLYPTLGLQTPGEIVEANFGQSDFVFDFDKYLQDWRLQQQDKIENFEIANSNGNHEDILTNIVFDYLSHQGFKESSELFAKSMKMKKKENIGTHKEDDDTDTRLEMTNLILDGKISETIDNVNLHYPDLLKEDSEINFYLKYRQLIELIAGTDGEMKKYKIDRNGDADLFSCGNEKAIGDMILLARDLNEIIQNDFPSESREEKENLMNMASSFIIETLPKEGKNSQLFDQEHREKTAQLLSKAILKKQNKKKASSLSYIINQSNYLHSRLISREIAQAAFLKPTVYLEET